MSRRLDTVAALTAAVGCGRIGFGDRPVTDAVAADAHGDAAGDGCGSGVCWVKAFADHAVANDTFDAFTASADRAGDAIVLQLVCEAGSSAEGPSLVFGPHGSSGSGWITALALGGIEAGNNGLLVATAIMIAGDTAPVTFDTTWSDVDCTSMAEFGDEFTNNDPTGGSATFDAVDVFASGNCMVGLGTHQAGEAVWGGCTGTDLTGVGAGFTASVADAAGHWTAWRTGDPAGVEDMVEFTSGSASAASALTTVQIAPR